MAINIQNHTVSGLFPSSGVPKTGRKKIVFRLPDDGPRNPVILSTNSGIFSHDLFSVILLKFTSI
jgi:hypothetical protein